MSNAADDLQRRVNSPDPIVREAAALELGRYPASRALRYLVAMLSDESPEVIHAAKRSFVALNVREAVEAAMDLLRSEDARLRSVAVEIIAQMGSVAISPVTALLDERDRDVRQFAVNILKRMQVPEAEDVLIRALLDEEVNVAIEAAAALGDVGTSSAVPYLTQCLQKDPWLKSAAVRSLANIGNDEALQAILSMSQEEESIVLFCVVTALGNIGDSRGIGVLLDLLDRKDSALEPSIIQAIADILKSAGDQAIPQIRHRLPTQKVLGFLSSDDTSLVRSAIALLGFFQAEEAVETLVPLYEESNRHLFEDLEEALLKINSSSIEPIVGIIEDEVQPEAVKIAAARLLGQMGRLEACPPLMALLEDSRDDLGREIISALAALKDERALTTLHACLKNQDPETREAAIEAIGTFRDAASIPYLVDLVSDSSDSVRSTAAEVLKEYEPEGTRADIREMLGKQEPTLISFGLGMLAEAHTHEFGDEILDLCHHRHEAVREKAVEKASTLKDGKAFGVMVESLSDDMPGVRLAGIRGIEYYMRHHVGQQLLNVVSSDPEEWNRYEAIQAIGRLQLRDTLPSIASLLESSTEVTQAAILDVLGEIGGDDYAALITLYSEAENPLVRDAAIQALAGPRKAPL